MKKKLWLSLCAALALYMPAHAQNEDYAKHIEQAEKYYDSKDFLKSGQEYTKAFDAFGGKGMMNDRYNAACSWSMAGNKDSAFSQLMRIATKANYTNLNHLSVDTDLESLHGDKRWNELVAIVKQNKDKAEANLNKPLVAILDTVMREDQAGRMQLDEVEKKYGRDSKEIKALWKSISEKDSINTQKVTKILDEYGWVGPDVVGGEGSQAIFLVIQHADIGIQQKYLPKMREAVKNRKASPSALALLEDRVALRTGKKQIYGSQIGRFPDGKYYVSPLEDPDNVDKRRADVGLSPLADYVRNWQISWDVAAYKKDLPKIEAQEKKYNQ